MLLASMLLPYAMAQPPTLPEPAAPAPSVRISWSAPLEACPASDDVAAQLHGLVGDGGPSVDVAGTIERVGEAFRLDLEITTSAGTERRELHARDCELLSRAGVLVAAVAIDAVATASTLVARDDRDPDVPAAPAVPEDTAAVSTDEDDDPLAPLDGASSPEGPPRAPRSTPAPGWHHGLSLAARGGLAIAATPGLTGGVEGELAWRFGPLRVAVAGTHWFSRAESLFDQAGVRSALSVGTVRGCWAFTRPKLEVPLCAGLELGAMHGRGQGDAVREQTVRGLWVGIVGSGGVAYWPVPRFGLDAHVDAVVAARRPAMYLEVEGERVEVFRMPPLGARLLVGAIVRIF